ISESAGFMGIRIGRTMTLAQAEEAGSKIAADSGAKSLAELRAKSAEDIQRDLRGPASMIVDGWYLTDDLGTTFAQGKQNDADVLVGSTKDEGTLFRSQETGEPFLALTRERLGGLTEP